MKRMVSMLLVTVLFFTAVALAAPTSLTGTLTDSHCAKSGKHMMKGMSDAECVRACIKSGAKWALLSDGKVYMLEGGDKAKLNDLAGKRVTVTGEISGTNVAVKLIAAAK